MVIFCNKNCVAFQFLKRIFKEDHILHISYLFRRLFFHNVTFTITLLLGNALDNTILTWFLIQSYIVFCWVNWPVKYQTGKFGSQQFLFVDRHSMCQSSDKGFTLGKTLQLLRMVMSVERLNNRGQR